MTEPSDTPIRDALAKRVEIPDLPPGETRIAGQFQQHGESGISLEMEHDIGKPGGWTAGAQAGIWTRAGAAVKGWFRFRGTK
jgi:hypothetical protein